MGGMTMEMILTYDVGKQKKVEAGKFDEKTGTFFKECTAKHFMKIYGGFGISKEVMDILAGKKCRYIAVRFAKELKQIPFEIWNMQPKRVFGHGSQKFFSWDKMNTVESNQMSFL